MRWDGVTWLRRVRPNWLRGSAASPKSVGYDIVAGCVARPHTDDFVGFAGLPQAYDSSRPRLHDTTQQEVVVEDASIGKGADAAKAVAKAKKVGLDEIQCVGGIR